MSSRKSALDIALNRTFANDPIKEWVAHTVKNPDSFYTFNPFLDKVEISKPKRKTSRCNTT